MQDNYLSLGDADNVCLSGGADGADLQWGMTAGSRGDQVIHFGFRGHRSKAPESEIVTLTPGQLAIADEHLEIANKSLGRRWPVSNDFVANLLRRNYYQVAWSGSCYAVSEIDKSGRVKGGTAWATQMFQDLHPEGKLFVYDQKAEQWFQWKGAWVPMVSIPAPSGIWAGIGSRELAVSGKTAIRDLMGWKKGDQVIAT